MINTKRVYDLSILALVVMAVQMILSKYVYPYFGTATQQLFSITPSTAVTSPTIGTKILSYLSGIVTIPGNIMGYLTIFVGAFILLLLGYYIYDMKFAWKGKNAYQRLWAILLYGTAILYVFLLVTGMSAVQGLAVSLLIGLAVNYFILAFSVATLARYLNFLKI